MESDNLVFVSKLSFARGPKSILSNISLTIPKGKITAIMGPSGCGKTTLLNIIGGQLAPSSGEVLFKDIDIHRQSKKALYQLRQQMGLLFQHGGLFTDLSVFDNVAFPLREHTKLTPNMIRDIVLMKLEAVGLRGAHSLMPSSLSGGMARRVALARAIALDPSLMMYDEPFTGQDPISMAMLLKLIKALNQLLGMTSIIVSHDVDETLGIADYVYLLAKGRVIGHGTPKEIVETTNQEVCQFIQGLADGPVPFHYPAIDYTKELLDD
jgi:phospholipid/cholesterol/gamma-HCH transport system ATP-binding protein